MLNIGEVLAALGSFSGFLRADGLFYGLNKRSPTAGELHAFIEELEELETASKVMCSSGMLPSGVALVSWHRRGQITEDVFPKEALPPDTRQKRGRKKNPETASAVSYIPGVVVVGADHFRAKTDAEATKERFQGIIGKLGTVVSVKAEATGKGTFVTVLVPNG